VEDLAHEGFLSAQAHIGKCRVPTRLFAFAYTCAHRGILRWVAAQERRAAHEYRVASWDDLPEALLAVSPEGTIQSAVDYARYVAGLPAVTQTIWRKRLLGFSWREIALHEQQALSTLFRQHRPIACLVP
jgi:DNA-directed RNA polymerase specialized sigma24 family protein